MDLTTIRLFRRPRTACDDPLEICLVRGNLFDTRDGQPPDEKGLSGQMREWLAKEVAGDPLRWKEREPGKDSSREALFSLLGKLDLWLCASGDMPDGDSFIDFRDRLLKNNGQPVDKAQVAAARAYLCNWIEAELLAGPDWDRIRALTRLLLLLDLLDINLLPNKMLNAKGAGPLVWDLLHRRAVVLERWFSWLIGQLGIQLVREASVSDLFVVRSEWSCYLPSEIATILNVFAGESFEHKTTRLDEEETITTQETERIQTTEQSEEDRTQTEISREVARATSLQIDAEGNVNVSGQYGLTKFAASAQVGVSASLSESTRQANKIARDLVSKATSKVESRVREQRVRRVLTRIEDINRHTIDNTSEPNKTGIYRWVDRVDRYQVFRFPDRLQLEFQIPEPASYVRWRMPGRDAGDTTKIKEPPTFDVKVTSIDETNYADLALKYRASNLPQPPDKTRGLTAVLSANTDQTPADQRTETWPVPRIEKSTEVALPAGYAAKSVEFSGVASPYRANWRTEFYSDNKNGELNDQTNTEGFHYIKLTVAVGGGQVVQSKGGQTEPEYAVQLRDNQLGWENRSAQRYGESFLIMTTQSINLSIPATEKASLGIQAAGASTATVSFLIRCERTEERFAEWKNQVYDVLFDAWRAWDQAWRTQTLQQRADQLSGVDATSPARNKETVVEELKRQTISWLLDNSNFAGVDAMIPPAGSSWPRIDFTAARAFAPEVQFMEQAFEWGNLSYIFYPYYWARGSAWDQLADIQGADPEYVRFLRAGSARVIVPARPGFEQAVFHWLLFKQPFMGDPLPIPGDPLYVSIAQEIRDLTGAPNDGQPGESWENRMGTSLIWLDPEADLPQNTARRLGKSPNEPKDPICP